MEKLIIDARLNEYTAREPNPHIPFSPDEIGEDAARCRDAGASIVHYHARDPQTGAPSTDAALYAEAAREIRKRSDVLVMPTLGANTLTDLDARFAHIESMAQDEATRADLVPLDLASTSLPIWSEGDSSVGGDDLVYYNSVGTLKGLAARARAVGALPMAAIWGVASLRLLEAFSTTGVFPRTVFAELFLTEGGLIAGHPCTRRGLDALIDFLPPNDHPHLRCVWAVAAYGANLLDLAESVIERGGHIAVGLGDHPYASLCGGDPDDRTNWPTNPDVISAIVDIARRKGREIATPSEARVLLEDDAP